MHPILSMENERIPSMLLKIIWIPWVPSKLFTSLDCHNFKISISLVAILSMAVKWFPQWLDGPTIWRATAGYFQYLNCPSSNDNMGTTHCRPYLLARRTCSPKSTPYESTKPTHKPIRRIAAPGPACWCGGPARGRGGPGRVHPGPGQASEHHAAGKVILRTVSLSISSTRNGALAANAYTSTHSGIASVSLVTWRPCTTQRRWGTNLPASCLSNFLELLDITEAMTSVEFWLNHSSTLLYFFCRLKFYFSFCHWLKNSVQDNCFLEGSLCPAPNSPLLFSDFLDMHATCYKTHDLLCIKHMSG